MKLGENSRIEIIAVGNELLTPYYQDTDSIYITQRLNDLGIEINFKSIVGDSRDDLADCISSSLVRSDIIFLIGGLGPTEDDRTREVVASTLGKKLIFEEKILNKIRQRFELRGFEMPSVNNKQAYIIEDSSILENKHGTAPGLWLEAGDKLLILLPGPPHEIKPMFENYVWPRFLEFQKQFVARRVLKTSGLTESKIDSLLLDVYPLQPSVKLTTLAYPGQIELHLFSRSMESHKKADEALDDLEYDLQKRLGDNIFSSSGEELEEVVGSLLRQAQKTLSIAESCTGGLLGHRITNVSGSSDYFQQGVLTYSNDSKVQLLNIPYDLILQHGAVSHEVAKAMAIGIRKISGSDIALSITGIAGPNGGSPEKPVGLVYVGLSLESDVEVAKNIFLGNREIIKTQSSQKALDMLRRHLLKYQKKR
ncbi:MAG: competence/damage-inducible protein A [Candidatus Aminicenantaceae bacterium]